ncbi:MAG TPA: phytanoyl-CoA dioxygenase family protein [Thermoanaerobaculia bacterium]|nr:phytanoyl-CoA dioxygenase family protein [Thermoanaerobaculia bacterium]
MTITAWHEPKTEFWAKNEPMRESPNWHGVSPEVIARRGRPWNQDPNDVPWLDRDDAEERIQSRLAEGLISSEEAELLRQWVVEGYFILRGAIDQSDFGTIDQFNRFLDDLWTTDQVIPGLHIMSLHIKGRPPGPIRHAELLQWPLEYRLELRDQQLWRVHYLHCHSEAMLALTMSRHLLRMATLILEEPAVLASSIGFKWGSEVGVHQDLAAMHIHPKNRLVGVWLAGEDVDPLAGPLGVFPGSHRVPIWPGWNNYPQTNLRTCHLDTRSKEEQYLKDAVAGGQRVSLPVKKGDAILTHGLMIHGGDKIKNRALTRFSAVLHYTVPGGDKTDEITGPFNW